MVAPKRARRSDDDDDDDGGDDDGGDDDATPFGAFGTLPDELVVRVLERLRSGHALAMAACACRDFERLIGTRETLWRDAATRLEASALVRRDLVREDGFERRGVGVGEETNGRRGRFPKFSWKELYMWRVHVLKKSAQLDAKRFCAFAEANDARMPSMREASARQERDNVSGKSVVSDARPSAGYPGRLAVIDRERLFTCDPMPKGGNVYQIHESALNSFVPRTLVWAPKSQLLACAVLVDGPETSQCYNKILFSTSKDVHRKCKRRRAHSTLEKMSDDFMHGDEKDETRNTPPVKNILALPRGFHCTHMMFSPCGTFINFSHKDRMESALYTLDCATTLTSLYGPSNGMRGAPSPIPPPAEKVWKIASGSEDARYSFAPHDNSLALMVDGQRETFFVHKVRDWPLAPLSMRWPDVDEYDANYSDDDSFDEAVSSEEEEEEEEEGGNADWAHEGVGANAAAAHAQPENASAVSFENTTVARSEMFDNASFNVDESDHVSRDLEEVLSVEKLSWWQKVGRSVGRAYHATSTTVQDAIRGTFKRRRMISTDPESSKRIRESDSNRLLKQTCRRQSSWWSNIPQFRKVRCVTDEEHTKQPLTRVYCDDTTLQIEWVPPKRGDRDSRGFWLLPTAIVGGFDATDVHKYAYLVMAPVPSEEAIKNQKFMPFIGLNDDELFENIRKCVVTEISSDPAYREPNIPTPFYFTGRPGGEQVVWSTEDGLFVRCMHFDLDADGNWTGPPRADPHMAVLDFDLIVTGANQWNKIHDELSIMNFPTWNASRRVPVLSVMNQVIRHTIEAIQWSPSGERLLILLATHLAYDGNTEGTDFYTAHQWVCWDPPPRMSKGSHEPQIKAEDDHHGVLSFGSRFIPSDKFKTECAEKMDNLPQGLNLWSPNEEAVAFPLQRPRSLGTPHDSDEYIVIQKFPRIDLERVKEKSQAGDLPPLQQVGSVARLPYYMQYVNEALVYICEGSYCSWSPSF